MGRRRLPGSSSAAHETIATTHVHAGETDQLAQHEIADPGAVCPVDLSESDWVAVEEARPGQRFTVGSDAGSVDVGCG